MTAHHRVDSGFSPREDLDARIEQYRHLILNSLTGLTEAQARATPVPSRPSLLGVVRHTSYVEGVWFDEAITGRPRREIGLPVATANSWKTRKTDTIQSVTDECRRISDIARANLASLDLDDVVEGRSPRTVSSIFTHVLSELAWNTGQLDILRPLALTL